MFKKVLLLSVLMLQVAAQAVNWTYSFNDECLVGNRKLVIGQLNKPVFLKPAGYTNKDFLWQMIYETSIEENIPDNKLKNYLDTIEDLSLQQPLLLGAKRWGKTPQYFAAYNCNYCVGSLLDRLTTAKCSFYKPSQKVAKETAVKWADGLVEKISKNIFEHMYKFVESYNVTTSLQLDTGGDVPLTFIFSGTRIFDSNYSSYSCTIYYQGGFEECYKLAYCNISCDLGDNPLITIDFLTVKQDFRQNGFGRLLLRTVTALGENFAKKRSKPVIIALKAAPNEPKLLPVLINYYKSFGFIPNFSENDSLSMHIDKNGKILTAYELKMAKSNF